MENGDTNGDTLCFSLFYEVAKVPVFNSLGTRMGTVKTDKLS